MMNDFLIHDSQDNVGVAVTDIQSGQTAQGVSLDGKAQMQLQAIQDISLGHKIALKDIKVGETVIKYGEDIGRVVAEIRQGAHVHVHNLKTKRW
jgi:(2R)-sulfolactate sulfo-lyase subunit alpha